MVRTAFSFFAGILVFSAMAWTGDMYTQKYIAYGWDISKAGPEEILANADRFDALAIDGVMTSFRGFTPQGEFYSHATLFNGPKLTSELIAPQKEMVKKFSGHTSLRHNFLVCWMSPKERLAWDDDTAWGHFAENMRVVAEAAAECGMEGFFLDNEDYSKVRQYRHLKGVDSMTFDEAVALARRRGREVFSGVLKEHPKAALLGAWFFSWNDYYANIKNIRAEMRRSGDLWPAFLNGILDVLPPEAKFVEGDERGYLCFADRHDFHTRAFQVRQAVISLIEPENRAKYALQGQTSFGLFLDMYTPEIETGDYCRTFPPASDGSMLTRFMQNLEQASRVSSEYVWIYGQGYCWIDWQKTPESKVWSDKRFSSALLSGGIWTNKIERFGEALAAEKDGQGWIKKLLENAKASGAAKELVSGDATWTVAGKKLERRSISAPVTPGGLYAVEVSAEVKNSSLEVMAFWGVDGKRNHLEYSVFMPLSIKSGDSTSSLQEGVFAVRAPIGVDSIELRTSVWQKPDGEVNVGKISVIRVL